MICHDCEDSLIKEAKDIMLQCNVNLLMPCIPDDLGLMMSEEWVL